MSLLMSTNSRPSREEKGTRRQLPTALLSGLVIALALTPLSAQTTATRATARAARPANTPASGGPVHEPVRLSLVSSSDDVMDQLTQFPVTLLKGSVRTNTYLVEALPGTTGGVLDDLIDDLVQLPGMLVAEIDQRVFTHEIDSCIDDGMGGVTQVGAQQCTVAFVDGTPTPPEFFAQTALEQIDAANAQLIMTTYTPVVAVIDTGLDMSHSIFAGHLASAGWDFVAGRPRAWDLPNGLDDDGDDLIDEAYGHGTHIAGTVLAVAPEALILPVRVLDAEGNGSAYDVANGIFWAVANGADIINLSLSMSGVSNTVAGALQFAEANNVVVFTSAGNTGDDILFPGTYDPATINYVLPGLEGVALDGAEIVTVAAVDDMDIKAMFSAWGLEVDVSAPGVAVYSALPGDRYGWWSGTSMATAVASGVAALTVGIAGPFPASSPAQMVIDQSLPIDDINPMTAGGLGAGRTDALASAMAAVQGL